MRGRPVRPGDKPLILILRNPRRLIDRELATAPADAAYRTFGRPAVTVQRLADKLAQCGTPNAAGRRDQE
jgi:hypothetical protein